MDQSRLGAVDGENLLPSKDNRKDIAIKVLRISNVEQRTFLACLYRSASSAWKGALEILQEPPPTSIFPPLLLPLIGLFRKKVNYSQKASIMRNNNKHILTGVQTDHLFDSSLGLGNIAAGGRHQSAVVRFSVAITRADRLKKSTLADSPLGVTGDGEQQR